MVAKEEIAARVAAEVDRLPPIPSNIAELRSAVADPNMDFGGLVPLLKQDPGLCADLLKFANSAVYGVGHRVDTLEEAVLYFGMRNLAEFVAATFAEGVVRKMYSRLKGVESFFPHSREIARGCRLLTAAAGLSTHEREALTLAGLIHDIGKLVLTIAAYQPALMLVRAETAEDMRGAVERENELWGIDHCAVGAQLCEKWRFPGVFGESIRRHHTPIGPDGLCSPAAYVFLAHLVAVGVMPEAAILRALPEKTLAQLRLNIGQVSAVALEMGRPEA